MGFLRRNVCYGIIYGLLTCVIIVLSYKINNNAVLLEFEDNGILYDPLSAEAPDVTLPAGKRSIGGLGLFMVKKIASSVEYAEKDGWNDLKLIFEFDLPSAEKN